MIQTAIGTHFLSQLDHTLFHTMKEPLRNLACMSTLIHLQLESSDNRSLNDYTSTLVTNAERLAMVVNGLAELLDVSRHEVVLESGCLKQLVSKTWESLQGMYPHCKVQLKTTTALPTNSIDPVLLNRALYEVLKNAAESKLGAPVKIECQLFVTDETFVLEIKDDGNGIESDFINKITNPFETFDRTAHHRGLGLTLVQEIMVRHQGQFKVSSELNHGTKVQLIFPRPKDNQKI